MLRIVITLVGLAALVVTVGACDEDPQDCGGCVIDGACHEDLDVNPANSCQVCDVSVSATAWTDNDGASCDDELYCNGVDTCQGGGCADHAGDPCSGIGLCDEDADNCDGECDGCLMGSTCYADGETNPEETCEVCDVAASETSWTAADGVSCDDDRFCNGADTCSGGSCSDHAGDPCIAPQMCDESLDVCDASCEGCIIGTICYGDTTANPLNVCQICDVATSDTAWTAADGASCEDGDFCTGTDTCVGDQCVHTGDPCDATETCDSTSASCETAYGSCLAPIIVTGDATLFGVDFTVSFGDDHDLQNASCDGGFGFPETGAAEAVFQVTLGPGQSVRVRESGGLDTAIMVTQTCSDTAACLVAADQNEDTTYATTGATEIVHVIVSSWLAAPTTTDYSISFELSGP